MSNYKKCKKCDTWHYDNIDCLPVYKVFYEPYMGDESNNYHASDFEDAALLFAQWYNIQTDYSLMNKNITVRVVKDGIEKNISVSAEPDVHYRATVLK